MRTVASGVSDPRRGLVIGRPENDERSNARLARELGAVVAAYRRLAAQSGERSWDPDRGERDPRRRGLAANLVAWLHDHGPAEGLPQPVIQVLIYPKLDDRTVRAPQPTRVWSAAANRFGWSSYLGGLGLDRVPNYAVAARREDLSGLPPAWIGVGTLDLFHEESLTHGHRLRSAGVETEVYVVPGAFHAFDSLWKPTPVGAAFTAEWTRALRAALT